MSQENRPSFRPVIKQIPQSEGDTWKTPYLTTEPVVGAAGIVVQELVEVVDPQDFPVPRSNAGYTMPWDGPGDDMR